MFNWSTSIGRVLGEHVRARAAMERRLDREHLELSDFCARIVLPVMQDLARECEAYGRVAEVRREGHFASLTILQGGKVEFRYAILASRAKRRKSLNRYRDSSGYGRDVDRVYSLREARRMDADKVARHIVTAYRKVLSESR